MAKRNIFKKLFSKEEKKAFRSGMAYQYNKEHPKFRYAVAEKTTYFNADGTVAGKPSYGKVYLYKTQKEAVDSVKKKNSDNRYRNLSVLNSVKNKKVNVYDSYSSSITYASYKKIKPTRDIGYLNYNDLK